MPKIMKKIYCLLSAALAALCIASCTKAELTDNETPAPAGNVLTFTATQAEDGGADDVKTYITEPKPDGSYVIRWASGAGYDERIVVNGVKSNVAQMVEGTYNTKATFHVEMDPAGFYCAMNPTNLFGKFDAEAKTMEVYVNATANYKTTGSETKKITYDPLTSLIAAYSTTTDLTFHHLMAYYKLVVDGGETYADNLIERVVVRQGGDTPNIAGVYTLTFSEDAITLAPKNLTKLISYFAPEEGLAMGTEMMIAVPALNFESGLIFTVYCKDGSFHSFSVPAVDLSQKAGKVISKTVTYNPQSGVIKTAADWEAFAAAFNAANSKKDSTAIYRWVGNGTVTLGADITLPGDFTRVANEFNYTFDGNGHTITIEGGQHALFFTLGSDSVVKNLTTAGSIVGGSSADGVTVLANSLYGTVQDCTNNADITISKAMNIAAAPFGKAINHGVISNCVNNGAITVTCDATQANYNVYAGGIVARVNPSGSDGSLTSPAVHIVNCTNNGAIKVTLNNTGHKIGYAGYGGITGWVARNYSGGKYPVTIFEGCTNTGAITVTNTDDSTSDSNFAVCLGGIMGIGWGDYLTAADAYHLGSPEKANNQNKIYFKNCTNSGKLTNNTTAYCESQKLYGKSYVGGIAGSMFGFKSVFDDEENQTVFDGCVNSGNISGFSTAATSTSIVRNGLTSIAGGLVGIGANVSFKNCTVTGEIGNTKRIVFAVSGGIGVAAGKFRFDGCTFYPKLIMGRCFSSAQDNWALVAVSPRYVATSGSKQQVLFAGGNVPAITGSVVKNCNLGVSGCSLTTANATDVPWNYTGSLTFSAVKNSKFKDLDTTETFSVQGTNNSGSYNGKSSGDVTFTGNVYQNSAPAVTTAAPAPMALNAGNTYNY